jgi:hypothetical protein
MSSNITDFEALVQQYADKIAKERGTKVKWICIDGSQSHIKEQYPDMKVSVNVQDPVFFWDAPSLNQDMLYKDRVTNNGSESVSTTISRSESVSNNFSWSTTEGIKVGASVKVSAKFAGIGAETEESFEFNFSSTQGESKTTTKTWGVNKTIVTPPKSSTEISWILDRNKSAGTFKSDVTISGNVAIWFKDKIDLNIPGGSNLHWLWFPTPASVIRELDNPNGFRTSGRDAIFNAVGKANADVGLESQLWVNETPITQNEGVKQASLERSSPSQILIFDKDGTLLQDNTVAGVSPEEATV